MSLCSQMEVIVGDFGIVVVPRDGVDTERIMNHSSILRKYKVSFYSMVQQEGQNTDWRE